VPVDKLDNELVKHNLVVFRNGENALQVLPPLLDIIGEARSNLVIHHLHENNIEEAQALLLKEEPNTPEEYILKGVTNAFWGQLKEDKEVLKKAQQYLQLVGSSASHCDTIPGRQSMAMCFFLMEQFDDSLIYLKSIKAYCGNDDHFKWNFGVALASVGKYSEAALQLTSIQSPALLMDFCCISWTCKCFIYIGRPQEAWEMYLRMDNASDSFLLLQVLANDCYKTGAFYFSLKAFDVLERLDPTPQYLPHAFSQCFFVTFCSGTGTAKRAPPSACSSSSLRRRRTLVTCRRRFIC
jgi:intraflagellar transport protein 56